MTFFENIVALGYILGRHLAHIGSKKYMICGRCMPKLCQLGINSASISPVRTKKFWFAFFVRGAIRWGGGRERLINHEKTTSDASCAVRISPMIVNPYQLYFGPLPVLYSRPLILVASLNVGEFSSKLPVLMNCIPIPFDYMSSFAAAAAAEEEEEAAAVYTTTHRLANERSFYHGHFFCLLRGSSSADFKVTSLRVIGGRWPNDRTDRAAITRFLAPKKAGGNKKVTGFFLAQSC